MRLKRIVQTQKECSFLKNVVSFYYHNLILQKKKKSLKLLNYCVYNATPETTYDIKVDAALVAHDRLYGVLTTD